MFALVDCNNFYVSCERVFRPELNHTPVVVLSNNDGCFISRSDEVKHLGIPMGAPYFKWKDHLKEIGARVFSANFSLYGDMSHRVMSVLSTYTPNIEIYSIDEAFLSLEHIVTEHTAYAEEIAETVQKWVGIPVSVGIGPTKTLAKLANGYVKKNKHRFPKRVFNIATAPDIDAILHRLPVSDVWGIGRAYTGFLEREGIKTVYQLKHMPDRWVEKHMTIVGLRMVHELRGISCLPLEEVRPMKKGIMSSRSFGRPVTTLTELKEAVSTYTARAAEKLRHDKAMAGIIQVMVQTNRFDKERYYSNKSVIPLQQPSNYTPELTRYALRGLEKIYRSGERYKKAAVMLTAIVPETRTQLSLLADNTNLERKERLMQTLDSLNRMHGRRAIRFAAEGLRTQLWTGKRELQSPRYTTHWNDLFTVR